ncbi:MAG: hypothetical protein E7636_04630 [Ruminococcaceae bacterium]|nr:hypothetical protein [Oscillospiraceae bacterium]
MKKKKLIITWVFVALIILTVIGIILLAVENSRYDPGPGASGVDYLPKLLGWFYILIYGTLAILYDLDLFYTVYYFLIKPKTKVKSVLNILCNLSLFLCLLLMFVEASLVFLAIYIELRFAYFLVSVFTRALSPKQQ